MLTKPDTPTAHSHSSGSKALTLPLMLLLAGCATTSPLARHTAAFSTATNVVVDNSENAYRVAVRIHDDEQISAIVQKYDSNQPWDPHSIKHLIDAKGLETRTDILNGLKTYAQSLADIANNVQSDQLDAAATSVGANLKKMGDTLNPTDTDTAPRALAPGITIAPQQANAVSAALKALGDYLVNKKVKSGVPKVIRDMDPQIDALCKLLDSDLVVLRRQSGNDYEQLLVQQDMFIRKFGGTLSPTERRAEIKKLPQILARKEATDAMLQELQESIHTLAQTHHALAATAQSSSAASLNERIADLKASGERLAHFYSSLPTT
ncbi:MAG TPA: hypothetical protein VK608_14435 [Edaphobacter sp.]|nr:hypothetical protein [Edaphobacter sp.]